MIVGVGIDLVETSRFARSPARVLERLFTPAERAWCSRQPRPALHYAARFAAKEAALKAMGTGWAGGIAWTDVEVVRAQSGTVSLRVTGRAAREARRLRVRRWHVSLTHVRALAAAVVAAER